MDSIVLTNEGPRYLSTVPGASPHKLGGEPWCHLGQGGPTWGGPPSSGGSTPRLLSAISADVGSGVGGGGGGGGMSEAARQRERTASGQDDAVRIGAQRDSSS